MEVSTGRLVAGLNAIPENERSRFSRVPAHLFEDAKRELNGEPEVMVNLNLQSNLAAWAAKERVKNRKRAKIAKRSRARNRK